MVRFIDLIYVFRSLLASFLFLKKPYKWHVYPIENALFGTIQGTEVN